MDHYKTGKRQLSAGDAVAAKASFEAGSMQGDIRCIYGLLAVAAVTHSNASVPLERLYETMPQIMQKADGGDSDCCFILGRCFETGSAVKQDMPSAIKYYTKAAELGDADAMFNLGCIYIRMGEVGRNIARDYYKSAAHLGCDDAKRALEHMRCDCSECDKKQLYTGKNPVTALRSE